MMLIKLMKKDILSKSKELGWSSNQLQQHLNQAKMLLKQEENQEI